MTGEKKAASAWTTPLRVDLWKKRDNTVSASQSKEATTRRPAITQKDASSHHAVSQAWATLSSTCTQKLAPPNSPNCGSSRCIITTSTSRDSVAQKSSFTSSTLPSAQAAPTTPYNDTTKQLRFPQARSYSPTAVAEWQEVRSRRTKSVTPSNRKPLTSLVTSNSLNSSLVDTCVDVPIEFHVTDKIRVPRRTKKEELVEACKENLAPGTGHIAVSPAKSVNSDTHVEIVSTLEEFKAGFNTKVEKIRCAIREEYTQALQESERRILDRLGLFADLGVDILTRSLQDQVLDKMREYTNASEDDTHTHQANLFYTTFASNLREEDIQQLRHSNRRKRANEIAHAVSSADGAKRRNEQLLRHLKKYGLQMEAETCQRFVNFLYGRTTVIKRRR